MTDLAERLEPYQALIVGMYVGFFAAGCLILHIISRAYGPRIRAEWPDSIRTISARPWQWTDAAYVIAPTLLLSATFAWFARDHFAQGRFLPIAIELFLTHAPMIIAASIIVYRKRSTARDAFGISSDKFLRDLALGLALYLAMIAIVFPTMIITEHGLRFLGHEPAPQEIVDIFSKQTGLTALMFFASWTVLIAPIAEEIIFRGILLPLLLRKLSAWIAIPVLSVVFALIHGDVTAFLPLFAVSTCLSLAFIVTRSLTVTIAMHALFNSVTTAILLLTG